jgi:hypothetical protein
MLSVEAGPGPRKRADEAPFFATRKTATENIPVCVACLASPAGELISALISDRSARPVGVYPGQCVVVCSRRRPRLRNRLGLGSVVIWPDSGLYTCPVCGLPCRGWGANAPRSQLDWVASIMRRRFALPAGKGDNRG